MAVQVGRLRQISGVSAVYNRAKYLEEMRQAVQLYERHLISTLAAQNLST